MTSLNAVGSANKNNIIMTANGKKYEKPGLAKTALGIVAANVAAGMIMDGTGKLGNLYFKKINASVTDAQQQAYKNVVDDVLIKSGLAQKGVTLVDITEENKDTFKKIVYEDISPNLKRSLKEQPYVKEIFDKKVEKMTSMVAKGKQAYHFRSNNVITPLKPIVCMSNRSSEFEILLVACFEKASSISSGWIPEPLSDTLIERQSLLTSISTPVAPASIEFSTSSFTTEAGLSITSPAAI